MIMLENVSKINKLTASLKQLNTAIYMFFEKKDDISIHTIAGASNEILRTLVKVNGKDLSNTMTENDHTQQMTKKEMFTLINAFKNFFKHADKDYDKTINFDPVMNHYHIIDSIILLNRLDHKHTPETLAFLIWFDLKYPDFFKWDNNVIDNIPRELFELLDFNDFDFFKQYINILYKELDKEHLEYSYNVNC